MKPPRVVACELATVPDLDGARRLNGFGDLDDADVVRALGQQRVQRGQDERLLPHLQRIVAIGVACRDARGLELRALGAPSAGEGELLAQLFERIAHADTVVSWDAEGRDRAVLAHRALLHGAGPEDASGWPDRYLPLATTLGESHTVPRQELAELAGLRPEPVSAHGTWADYQAGRLRAIRERCAVAAACTYRLHLRYLRFTGRLDAGHLVEEDALADTAEQDDPSSATVVRPDS